MFFNQTFQEFMGRFVWNKWKQSCHQTFESPEETVLFAFPCRKRRPCLRERSRWQYYLTSHPGFNAMTGERNRQTRHENMTRGALFCFSAMDTENFRLLRQRIKTVQNSNASTLQKTPVTTFRTAKIVIVMYTWAKKKLTDTVLTQTPDD